MSVQSIEQLRMFMLDMEDLKERLARVVLLWTKIWDKRNFRTLDIIGLVALDDSDESIILMYDGFEDGYGRSCYKVSIPAKYLFMLMDDIKADIRARRREYLRQQRKEREERDRKAQQERDEWIRQEYAKIQKRLKSTKKKGGNNA